MCSLMSKYEIFLTIHNFYFFNFNKLLPSEKRKRMKKETYISVHMIFNFWMLRFIFNAKTLHDLREKI